MVGMKIVCALLMSALVSGTAYGAVHSNGLPTEAQQEICRRGASCERVNGYQAANPLEQAFYEAMQPPSDDSDKWFITIYSSPNCPACEAMKDAFASDPVLKSWGDKDNPKDSATHFHIIDVKEPTQGWRHGRISGSQFPALIIQPPLNGKYGEATTALPKIIGFTDAKSLARDIRDTCKTYIEQYVKPDPLAKADTKTPFKLDEQKKTFFQVEPEHKQMDLINLLLATPYAKEMMLALAVFGLIRYRKTILAKGMQPFLDEDQFADFIAILNRKKA
jgi:hypothetical protein